LKFETGCGLNGEVEGGDRSTNFRAGENALQVIPSGPDRSGNHIYQRRDAHMDSLIACHDCDLIHRVKPLPAKGTATCIRCGAVLYKNKPNSLERSLALAGCLGCSSVPTNFYMLSSLSPSQTKSAATAEDRIRIGLETVVIPEYLNRTEIVVNLDNTVYELADFDQWAEPLSDNLTRVLEENLTNLLRADSIDVFLASESSIPLDYLLEVDVLRLDGNLGDQVTLIAQWALFGSEEDDLKLLQRSEYQEPAGDNTYKELVLAKSRTVEKLSRHIAAAIKKTLANNSKQ
jgi:uncharacterized lipoprotein YmbA